MLLPDHYWPKCAKCGKTVDKVVSELNYQAEEYHVTAYCHGAEERITLPRAIFFDAEVSSGVAFKDDRDIPLLQPLSGPPGLDGPE